MRILFWVFCALLAACASENLYEGFKAREATRDAVAGAGTASMLPAYRAYEAERRRLLDHAPK